MENGVISNIINFIIYFNNYLIKISIFNSCPSWKNVDEQTKKDLELVKDNDGEFW